MTKLPLKEHLSRKSPDLRAALEAIGDAADTIRGEYEREQEVKPWLERLIRASETTARGSYVGEQLRKIRDRFRHDPDEPRAKRAIEAIDKALKRDGWK
jgi:hypothetical protein